MTTSPDILESRAPHVREQALMAALPGLVARAQQSAGWARILNGIDAAHIVDRASLAQLPVTRKSQLQALQAELPPFGGLTTVPATGLKRLFMSPGPIFDPEGEGEDWWRFARPMTALGLQRGHIVQNCFSYHFTPAAFMVEGAAAKLGCPVIPSGIGQTEMQVQAMAAFRPDAYIGTPSFLKIIVEKSLEMGADIGSLQRALVSGEALPPSLRTWLQQHGIAHVLQLYASADVGCIAYESETDGQVNPGMVLDEDLLLEIVRPGSGDPVPHGEVGEVVLTSFNRHYPLIRFATGDLSAVIDGPSPCGRSNVRIKGWMGRADQSTKVRGMFVHAAQVSDILKRHPEVRKARVVVTGAMANDAMALHCEIERPRDRQAHEMLAIAATVRELTKLRAEVVFMEPDSLPNDGKVIEDARSYD